jgi:hypothetical protein
MDLADMVNDVAGQWSQPFCRIRQDIIQLAIDIHRNFKREGVELLVGSDKFVASARDAANEVFAAQLETGSGERRHAIPTDLR